MKKLGSLAAHLAPSEDSDQPGHPITTHYVHSEDSNQTGQMPRLIWVFAGHTVTLLVLSCCGSYTEAAHFHKSQKIRRSQLWGTMTVQQLHTMHCLPVSEQRLLPWVVFLFFFLLSFNIRQLDQQTISFENTIIQQLLFFSHNTNNLVILGLAILLMWENLFFTKSFTKNAKRAVFSIFQCCYFLTSHLTHICLVDPSFLINWTSPFPILGVPGVLFHFYSIWNRYSC